jgi:transcription initiation factor TFIID subunit TAF12
MATMSERRIAENEAVFRRLNETVHSAIEETDRIAVEENQLEFIVTPETEKTSLEFYCECADENCNARISINLKRYKEIHKNRNWFIVLPGHEIASQEKVVYWLPGYTVVEKNINPPENPEKLNPTKYNNK